MILTAFKKQRTGLSIKAKQDFYTLLIKKEDFSLWKEKTGLKYYFPMIPREDF